jgi:hypothetical protein
MTVNLGDAVEVAQWPCCGYKVGQKFIVNAMEKARSGHLRCVKCGTRHPSELDALGPCPIDSLAAEDAGK